MKNKYTGLKIKAYDKYQDQYIIIKFDDEYFGNQIGDANHALSDTKNEYVLVLIFIVCFYF